MSPESPTPKPSAATKVPPPNANQYDWHRSYAWNYEHPPQPLHLPEPPVVSGDWQFCGLSVGCPLGIPAGPLLNSGWIHYYASLGFDVLTYKTVRSRARACHPLPNLVPVVSAPLLCETGHTQTAPEGELFNSWAISFGMPSRDPADWREDIRRARRGLGDRQILVVSIVASPEPEWTEGQIAADYVQCAQWAAESGADAIEANLSCPNVPSAEGNLFLHPHVAGEISFRLHQAVPDRPLILKVGVFPSETLRAEFCDAVSPHATAISTTNTVRSRVASSRSDEPPPFGGSPRGIGGAAIEALCLQELRQWQKVIERRRSTLQLIAVGGVASVDHVMSRIEAGAHHVQLATAAMNDPLIGYRIRRQWPPSPTDPGDCPGDA